VTDTHNNFQFQGDGTPAHPFLYDRDVLAILPFQANSDRLVIAYYVMTNNLSIPLTPETFTVTLQGLNASDADVSAYDPINDTTVPLTVNSASGGTLKVTLLATDYPYFLIIDE